MTAMVLLPSWDGGSEGELGARKGTGWLFPGRVIGSRAGGRLRRERAHGQAQSLLGNCVPIVPKAPELRFARSRCGGRGGPPRTRRGSRRPAGVAGPERESGGRTCPSGRVLDVQGSRCGDGAWAGAPAPGCWRSQAPASARSSGCAQTCDSAGTLPRAGTSRVAATVDTAGDARLNPRARTEPLRRAFKRLGFALDFCEKTCKSLP